ncbi:PaaI family thioesterase [Cupriavidus basilensis]
MPDNTPASQPYALENPFLESLDVVIEEWQPDLVRMSLVPQAAHVNNTGVVQGGILATLLDAAGATPACSRRTACAAPPRPSR